MIAEYLGVGKREINKYDLEILFLQVGKERGLKRPESSFPGRRREGGFDGGYGETG